MKSARPDMRSKPIECNVILCTARYLFLRCEACDGNGFVRRPCWQTKDANGVERCRVCGGDGSISVERDL